MTKEEIDASLKKTLGISPDDGIFKEDNEKLAEILADTSKAISEMNLNTVEEKKQMTMAVDVARQASLDFKNNPTESTAEFAKRSVVSAQDTLESISDQTKLMSETVEHIYGLITSSGIVDPDLVSSFAVLVSSAKDLWALKLDVYKMLLGQIQAINMENLKQEHRLELEEKKYELKRKLALETKNAGLNVGDKKFVFDNTEILKHISDIKRGKKAVVDVVEVEPEDVDVTVDDDDEPPSEDELSQ